MSRAMLDAPPSKWKSPRLVATERGFAVLGTHGRESDNLGSGVAREPARISLHQLDAALRCGFALVVAGDALNRMGEGELSQLTCEVGLVATPIGENAPPPVRRGGA